MKVGSIAEWEELDAAMDATLSNHVANEASATQGAALLRVVAGVHQELTFFKVRLSFALNGTHKSPDQASFIATWPRLPGQQD